MTPALAAKLAREDALLQEYKLVDEAAVSLDKLQRLKDSGANLDAKDTRGNTVLHYAAAVAPCLEKARNLCEAGASIEQRTISWIRNKMDRCAGNPALLASSKAMEQLLLEHQQRREGEASQESGPTFDGNALLMREEPLRKKSRWWELWK